MEKKVDVVGLGISVVDYLGIVPFHPKIDSRMQLLDFTVTGGGTVGTALVTLARLGASTSFVGKIGDDDFGRFFLKSLTSEGVDTDHLLIQEGGTCPFSFIIVDRDSGKRTILWSENDAPLLGPEELNEEQLLSGTFLYLDEYNLETAIPAARIAKDGGVTIVLDAESTSPGMETLLPLVDVLIASSNFARDYSGLDDFSEGSATLIRDMKDKRVCVTGGEKGCICSFNGESFHQKAFELQVVDTTGCGDVFHGAFIYGLLKKWDLRMIAEFSCAVAGLKCRSLGGRDGIPYLDEVERFLAEKRPMKR